MYGLARAHVLYFSRYFSLSPKSICTQDFCDVKILFVIQAGAPQGWRNQGGQGGHGPPKNLSGWAKVCFAPPPPPPPQNLDHWPPKNGRPVVKIFAKLLLSTLKWTKFSKIFRLRRANMVGTYSTGDLMIFQGEFLYIVLLYTFYSKIRQEKSYSCEDPLPNCFRTTILSTKS